MLWPAAPWSSTILCAKAHCWSYRPSTPIVPGGIDVAAKLCMLKLLGSYALAKLLGFGLVGAIVIYALLSLFI